MGGATQGLKALPWISPSRAQCQLLGQLSRRTAGEGQGTWPVLGEGASYPLLGLRLPTCQPQPAPGTEGHRAGGCWGWSDLPPLPVVCSLVTMVSCRAGYHC